MDFKRMVDRIVTGGKSEELRKTYEGYEQDCARLEAVVGKIEQKREQMRPDLERLAETKENAFQVLKDYESLAGRILSLDEGTLPDSQFLTRKGLSVISKVRENIQSMEDLLTNVAHAAGVGAATPAAAWLLVSTFGTASTGTAIGTLAGKAALNATLAWFGGGSVAAGGLGMAGGAAVIGGLAIIPMAIILIVLGSKKAGEKLEELLGAKEKVLKAISDSKAALDEMDIQQEKAREQVRNLSDLVEPFETDLEILKLRVEHEKGNWFGCKS